MRIDKYLKLSSLIKRRTVANKLCDEGRVIINGKAAKAGTNVKITDIISIVLAHKIIDIRVEDIRQVVRKNEANSLYTVLETKDLKNMLHEQNSQNDNFDEANGYSSTGDFPWLEYELEDVFNSEDDGKN